MRDYSQAKIYTIRNKKIVLVYMLVQLLNHCRNDWQNIKIRQKEWLFHIQPELRIALQFGISIKNNTGGINLWQIMVF